MRKIKNQDLAQLLMQLRFTPQKKRQKQLDSAEKLLSIVDKDKEYPFEFVCFKITGHHIKGPVGQHLIKGDELAEDLRIFVSKLSGQLAQPVAEQYQIVYSIEELASVFGVSTKTIHRWRKKDLIPRKFIFKDGVKRFGFFQSTVDDFVKKNPKLVTKAKNFERMTKEEKRQVIKQAMNLAAKTSISRYQIIEQIATKLGKAHETIRYTILNYEKSNPDKPIFSKPAGVIGPAQAKELYKMFKQGCSVKELMEQFNRSKSSIYRIINRRRAKELLARKIEFIESEEFLEKGAEDKILAKSIFGYDADSDIDAESLELADSSLPKYLQKLKNAPVLNREQEIELFRRYNYLKYLAFQNSEGLKPARVQSGQLKKIENYLTEAETIKKMIIEANLRLVVAIARKHTISGTNLLDLVSEGNFSLLRAVEKFDYTRGFRFGTYASWAIAKDFARKIPAEAGRPDKAPTVSLANIQRDLRITEAADFAAIERARKSLIQVIKDELSEREQYVILNHFGLIGPPIKKKTKTLKQIGEELELSKERVRQIELIALQKLRHSLSIKQFELLTG